MTCQTWTDSFVTQLSQTGAKGVKQFRFTRKEQDSTCRGVVLQFLNFPFACSRDLLKGKIYSKCGNFEASFTVQSFIYSCELTMPVSDRRLTLTTKIKSFIEDCSKELFTLGISSRGVLLVNGLFSINSNLKNGKKYLFAPPPVTFLLCLIQNNEYLCFLTLFFPLFICSLFFAGRPLLILHFKRTFC